MERLTYYNEYGLACYDIDGTQHQNRIASRLAAYEDTGFTPRDITAAEELYEALGEIGAPIWRVREWRAAEKVRLEKEPERGTIK